MVTETEGGERKENEEEKRKCSRKVYGKERKTILIQ